MNINIKMDKITQDDEENRRKEIKYNDTQNIRIFVHIRRNSMLYVMQQKKELINIMSTPDTGSND